MKAFLALVRLSLLEMFNAIAGRGSRKQAVSAGLALTILTLLCLMLSFTYSASLSVGLKAVGALDLLPGLMSVLALLMAFLLTVFAAGGMLFGGKDNDIILALPVSDYAVLLSRMLAVYLENLLIAGFVLLPMAAVYVYSGGPAGAAAENRHGIPPCRDAARVVATHTAGGAGGICCDLAVCPGPPQCPVRQRRVSGVFAADPGRFFPDGQSV